MRALDFVPSRKRKDHLPCPIPANKSQRLVALRSYEVLDTAPEIAYDEIVELQRRFAIAPSSLLVSLTTIGDGSNRSMAGQP